jgi:hypothetical protein
LTSAHLLSVGYEQEFVLVKMTLESFVKLSSHDPGWQLVCASPMEPKKDRLEVGVKMGAELGVSEIIVAHT